MWKVCGYIVYTGIHPISAKYMIYDQINEKLMWVDDSNNATIFNTLDYAKCILSKFSEIDMNNIYFRSVIMTDESCNK